MNIVTEKSVINQNPQIVFEFLNDINNLEKLMPEEKVSNWMSDSESCSFQIQGLSTIALEKKDAVPHQKIHLSAKDNKPFAFDLIIYINETNNASEVHIDFNANVNPFMKMMIEKPLSNFFNYLVNALEKQF